MIQRIKLLLILSLSGMMAYAQVQKIQGRVMHEGEPLVKANVVDCPDFAAFIVEHMNDTNVTYNVGGKETYTYEEMAAMCFDAAGKPLKIKWAPIWLFGIRANLPKIKKAGKHDIILFSKWTLSHDLVGDTITGDKSFGEYIKNYFGKEE